MEIRPSTVLAGVKLPDQSNKTEERKEARGKEPTRNAQQQSQSGQRLASLESSVANNEAARVAVSNVGNQAASTKGALKSEPQSARAEVEKANVEASRSEVRDVESAATLASNLASAISAEGTLALDAQANQEPERVEQLLV